MFINYCHSLLNIVDMNLQQWCKIDEHIYIAESDERFKQYAGLNYSQEVIEQLADMKLRNAQIFLDSFSTPREIFLTAIENIADAKTKKLELRLHNTRNTKIVSSKYSIGGIPVNWNTWRQFNNIEKEPAIRREVFDEFILKTKHIAPIIENRFEKIRDSYAKYGAGNNRNKVEFYDKPGKNDKDKKRKTYRQTKTIKNPLDGYLESEKITYSELIKFVKSMGRVAREPFRAALVDISAKILHRNPEYFDDFYFFRNKVYYDFEKYFSRIDPLKQINRILDKMQFDRSRIFFDITDRENKYPSPICFFVQIPCDIRVLYKSESPYFDLQACFHETGHAAHGSSIEPSLEYWSRYNFPMGVAEIFSIFFERLTKSKIYLKSELGINDERNLQEIIDRSRFMELFFVTFYTANSLMKAEYWRSNLSIENANSLYSKLVNEYTSLEMPGEYWMLHHILPESIMYIPSYLIAAVRAAELEVYIQNKFGDRWWSEAKAGKIIRELMEPGAKIELSRFSKLDMSRYMNELIRN
jgi:hypothetical protein